MAAASAAAMAAASAAAPLPLTLTPSAGPACVRRSEVDFITLRELGHGAFGVVTQVRHRLDGRVYALKRILLSRTRQLSKVLREAQILASTSHERLQRYFSAWLEEIGAPAAPGTGSGSGAGGGGAAAAAAAPGETGAAALVSRKAVPLCSICGSSYRDWSVSWPEWSRLDAALRPLHLCVACYEAALRRMRIDLSAVTITYTGETVAADGGGDGGGGGEGEERDGDVAMTAAPAAPAAPLPPAPASSGRGGVTRYLYILTEYCDRTLMEEVRALAPRIDTLSDEDPLLATLCGGGGGLPSHHPAGGGGGGGAPSSAASESGSSIASDGASPAVTQLEGEGSVYVLTHAASSHMWGLFWQIVEGLAYLHAQSIVHRDLKPSNVFCSGAIGSSSVKIGDLGLATTLVGSDVTAGEEAAAGERAAKRRRLVDPAADGAAGAHGTAAAVPERAHASEARHGGGEALVGYKRRREPDDDVAAGSTDGMRSHFAALSVAGSTHGASRRRGEPASHRSWIAQHREAVRELQHSQADAPPPPPLPPPPHAVAVTDAWGDAEAGGSGDAHGAAGSEHGHPQGHMHEHGHPHDHEHGHVHRGHHGGTAAHTQDTRGVGTLLYMPPEASEGRYSDRSDIYSLGVVLYEMWSRFTSNEERVRMLVSLKQGAVPRSFLEAFPVQAQLISNLMQDDPARRPSASDLLRYRYFSWSPASTTLLWPHRGDGGGASSSAAGGAASTPATPGGGTSGAAPASRAGGDGLHGGLLLQPKIVIRRLLHSDGPLTPTAVPPSPGVVAAAAAYAIPTSPPPTGAGHSGAHAWLGAPIATSGAEPQLHIQVPLHVGDGLGAAASAAPTVNTATTAATADGDTGHLAAMRDDTSSSAASCGTDVAPSSVTTTMSFDMRREAPTLLALAGDVAAVELASAEVLRRAVREALHVLQLQSAMLSHVQAAGIVDVPPPIGDHRE